jgi:hypothetical protein
MTPNLTIRQAAPAAITVRGDLSVLTVRPASPNQIVLRSDSSIVLAPATNTTLGGIIVGANLTISASGVLSALSNGGGPGTTSLSELTDVQLASPSSGDLIAYNQSNLKWVNIKQSSVTDGGTSNA